jgi:hypothetical protein
MLGRRNTRSCRNTAGPHSDCQRTAGRHWQLGAVDAFAKLAEAGGLADFSGHSTSHWNRLVGPPHAANRQRCFVARSACAARCRPGQKYPFASNAFHKVKKALAVRQRGKISAAPRRYVM